MADRPAIDTLAPMTGRQRKEDDTPINVSDKTEEALGGKGFELIEDAAAHAAPAGQCFIALHFVEDTVIAAYLADASAPITGTIIARIWLAGTVLYGKFTSVTLTSGAIVAYRGVLQ
jgi:hypothetical protein